MIRRLVAAGVMLVLAVALLLAARDAFRWQQAMDDADARAALGPVPAKAWDASTVYPSSLVRRVLGVNDDVAFRATAEQALFQAVRVPNEQQAKERAVIESALARMSRDDSEPLRAAAAADDLGVLFYYDPPTPANAQNPYQNPSTTASGSASPSERAESEFTLAVRLDPLNDNALRNLEMMLRAISPSSKNQTPRSGQGDRLGAKGSGSRLPGHGY
jgi:hypothetical protein